jgi:uncharacterized protein (DUF2267 family)
MQVIEELIVDRLLQLAPFEGSEHARRVFTVTLSALRDLLTEDEATWLSEELGPLPLRRRRQRVEAPSPEALYRRVALYAGTRPSVAREHAQVVCRALAESVPGAAHRLQKTLPPLAELFALPEPAPLPVVPERLRGHPGLDHTLAGGRPGSTRPLHDAGAPEADGPSTRREGRALSHEHASDVRTHRKRGAAAATIAVKRRKPALTSAGTSAAVLSRSVPAPQPTTETTGRGFTEPELADDMGAADDVERG